jgi:NAD(P)-dependent dehydrogenase (short-subunit alcohol dehydrogenase family)
MAEVEQHKSAAGEAAHLRTYKEAVVIVTGGASGIGRALAEELAQKGAHAVVLVDRQSTVAEEVATKLRSAGVKAKAYEVDVRDAEKMEQVVKDTVEEYGRLDYIFNNAGTTVGGPLERVSVEDFYYVLDVNVRGVVNGVLAAYPIMKEQGFGHIVNTASLAGLLPNPEGFTPYATSKHAIVGLSTTLRVEAARHGVNVSVVCPGVINTPLLKCGKFGKNLGDIPSEEMDKMWAKYHPMDPNDFAAKALKLVASNKPIIVVPGGPLKMWWFVNRISPSLGLYLTRKKNDKMCKKLAKVIADKQGE